MNKEEIKAKIEAVKARIKVLEQELTPVATRILAFRAIGMIAGGVWAWKTKQKWYVKPLAAIGGGIGAGLVADLILSNDKGAKATELQQLRNELQQLNSDLRKVMY